MDVVADAIWRETEAARGLVAALRDAGADDDTLTDMVEGETSLHDAIQRAISEMDECDIMDSGLAAKIVEFSDRRKRVVARSDRLRSMVEQALAVADVPSMRLATATLALRQIAPRAIVSDEALVPSAYWKTPDPVIDKAAINAAVAGGAQIPGVSMTNGTVSLQIRRK